MSLQKNLNTKNIFENEALKTWDNKEKIIFEEVILIKKLYMTYYSY